MRDKALWDKLAAFDFSLSGPELTLFAKLTKATTLSSEMVGYVMNEYRKFLYLAAVSDRVVAPSKLLDDVWHIHMLDTRAYLNGLCSGVIGKTIHHMPGRPVAYKDEAYLRTLQFYQEEFGYPPNQRIWPNPRKSRLWIWKSRVFYSLFLLGFGLLVFSNSKILILGLLMMIIAWGVYSGRYAPVTLGTKSSRDSGGCGGDGGGGDGCGGGD